MEGIDHIAIILDGNRRWARERGKGPRHGHQKGAYNLEDIVIYANKKGLKYLTAYVFSLENLKRDPLEVKFLMGILLVFFKKFQKKAMEENLKIKILGTRVGVPKQVLKVIDEITENTKNNTGLQVNLCFYYGGRNEIVTACKNIAEQIKNKEIDVDDINEELLTNNMYTKGIPDPDIIIRTSGEFRLSGFLPWQSIYSEFFLVKKYWPDFTGEDLEDVINQFKKRDRKFGGK